MVELALTARPPHVHLCLYTYGRDQNIHHYSKNSARKEKPGTTAQPHTQSQMGVPAWLIDDMHRCLREEHMRNIAELGKGAPYITSSVLGFVVTDADGTSEIRVISSKGSGKLAGGKGGPKGGGGGSGPKGGGGGSGPGGGAGGGGDSGPAGSSAGASGRARHGPYDR